AAVGGAAHRLSRLVPAADARAAHGRCAALAALVPLVQRGAGTAAAGDRDTRGGQALSAALIAAPIAKTRAGRAVERRHERKKVFSGACAPGMARPPPTGRYLRRAPKDCFFELG